MIQKPQEGEGIDTQNNGTERDMYLCDVHTREEDVYITDRA
jgi:hypothetical protein